MNLPAFDRSQIFQRLAKPLATVGVALAMATLITLVLDVTVLPILLREQGTDWVAYEEGAAAVRAHANPYAWAANADIRAAGQYPYLYPPALAAIWSLGVTAAIWAGAKILAVGSIGAFAWRSGSSDARSSVASPWIRLVVGAALATLTLLQPPVIHDLLLGNVMVLYVAALAILCAGPNRWWAAVPLGVVLALAFKPAIAPVLVWLLVRRRRQLLGLVAAAGLVSGVTALIVGPSVYVDYLRALPHLGGLAQPFSGNVGVSSWSPALSFLAIPVALAWSTLGARLLDPRTGLVVAVAMMLIAQPTLGLAYGGVLIPAVILLWQVNRPIGACVALVLPLLIVTSPPIAGIAVAATATAVGWRGQVLYRRGTPVTPSNRGAEADRNTSLAVAR